VGPEVAVEVGQAVGAEGRVAVEVGQVEVGQAEVGQAVGAAGRVAVEVGQAEVGQAGKVAVEVGQAGKVAVEVGQAEGALPVVWQILTRIITAALPSVTTR
jgi:hypothetical protein